MPTIFKKCYDSWKTHCPDYEFVFWNHNNVDISGDKFLSFAFENKKYSRLNNYFRLKVVYEQGGVYLDTDVEILKSIDELLLNSMFMSFADDTFVNTGNGFGAVKGHNLLEKMLKNYQVNYESLNNTSPVKDTLTLLELGVIKDKNVGNVYSKEYDVMIYSYTLFSPHKKLVGPMKVSNDAFAIHHYSATWMSDRDRIRNDINERSIRQFGPFFGKIISKILLFFI
jgi:hypothetical protein